MLVIQQGGNGNDFWGWNNILLPLGDTVDGEWCIPLQSVPALQYLHQLDCRRAAWAFNSAERSEPAAEGEVWGVVDEVGASPSNPDSGVLYLSGAVQLP